MAGDVVQERAERLNDDPSPQARAQFERLYRTHASAVRRHLAYLTGDASLAEDFTQEAFGKLYERSGVDGGELANPRAWLLTVASNLAYNHFRAESRRETRESAQAAGDAWATAPIARVDDVLDVRHALGQLEPRDRVALMLRHTGFSYAEVAEALGVSASSVGTILARAQSRFRIVYEGKRRAGAEKE